MENENKQGDPRGPLPFPAPALAPGQTMAVPPELLVFAAIFDPAPAEPGKPRKLHFMLGPALHAAEMTPQQMHVLLGELRTQIRKWVAAQGNTTLADGL